MSLLLHILDLSIINNGGVCYVYIYIGIIRLSYYSCCFLSCSMYIVCNNQLYTVWSNDGNGTNLASLLLLLLWLLIVLYDGVGMFNETIVMDWYVVCRVSSNLQRIISTRLFTITVHL